MAGGIGGITMILIMFGDGLFSFSAVGDARYNNPGFITKMRSSRIELYNKGLLLAFSISIGALGLIWGLIYEKIKRHIFVYGLLSTDWHRICWISRDKIPHVLSPRIIPDRLFKRRFSARISTAGLIPR